MNLKFFHLLEQARDFCLGLVRPEQRLLLDPIVLPLQSSRHRQLLQPLLRFLHATLDQFSYVVVLLVVPPNLVVSALFLPSAPDSAQHGIYGTPWNTLVQAECGQETPAERRSPVKQILLLHVSGSTK